MFKLLASVVLLVVLVAVQSSSAAPAQQPKAVQDLLDARDTLRSEVLRILDLHKVPHTRDGYRSALDKIIQLKPNDSIDRIMMIAVLHQLLATFPNGPFE